MLQLKTKLLSLHLLAFILLVACTEDDPKVSSEPMLSIGEVITGLPGEPIIISGLISDPAGLSKIDITYEKWSLAKTITLGGGVTQFELNYSFKVPDDEEVGSSHTIEISSTNPGQKVTATSVTVELSKDNSPPSISFASPANGGTFILSDGPELNLNFSVLDDTELSSVKVVGMGINETFEPAGTSFNYNEEVDFVLSGPFEVAVTATDLSGNVSTASVQVNIEESLKFSKFYLVDVATEEELTTDVFGVPLLTGGATTVEREGTEFEALYYNAVENTEIRFIPQKESFSPFAFGAGSQPGELALGSDESVDPIILTDIGYYKIIVNIAAFTYTVEAYTPTDDTFDFVQIIGRGVLVADQSTCTSNADGSNQCWNFASGKELTKDPSNPYRFTATVELFDDPEDDVNGFILNASSSGWSPFWRFDAEDVEVAVPNGGVNFTFDSNAYGTYTFILDTHLNQARVLPQ